MLIWVFFLHLVIVASPFHPHSRLSWICAWTSSFVHGVPSVFTVSPTLLSCRIFFHTSFFFIIDGVMSIRCPSHIGSALAVSVVICFSSISSSFSFPSVLNAFLQNGESRFPLCLNFSGFVVNIAPLCSLLPFAIHYWSIMSFQSLVVASL